MEQIDSSNPKYIRVEAEVRTEITTRGTIKTGTDQITGQVVETEDNTDKTEVGLETNKIIEEVILEEMQGAMEDKTVEESTEITIEMTVMTEVGTGLEKGHFPEIMTIIELEAQTMVHPGQDPELVQIGIEFIVISLGNMIILQGTVPVLGKRRR